MENWNTNIGSQSSLFRQLVTTFVVAGLVLGIPALVYQHVFKPSAFLSLSTVPAAHWTAPFSSRWMTSKQKAHCESRTIFAAHQRHGPIVRLGPAEVSVMSLEGIRKIYGGNFERTRWFDEFMNYGAPNLVTLYGKENHARRRRMVSNVFSKSFIQRSPDFHSLSATILWDRLLPVLSSAAQDGEGQDMFKLAFALGAEFMSAYEFGIQNGYNLVSPGRESVRDAYLLDAQRKLRGSEGSVKAETAARELEAQCMTMIEMTREDLQSTMAEDDDACEEVQPTRTTPVSFANLSDQIFEETKLSLREAIKLVASEMLDNIEAAREGVGIALTYATHELSLDGITQSALRTELRQAFASSPGIATRKLDTETLRALDQLPLLDAIITETLRLHPPAPGPQRRWVPEDGVVINDHYIPAGVTIHVTPYCIHRAPEAFPDAEIWNPARWLESKETAGGDAHMTDHDAVHNLHSYIFAFSSGSRTCLGNNFALIVIKLVLALIYTNFRTKVSDDEGIEQVDDVMGWPKSGRLILSFEKV